MVRLELGLRMLYLISQCRRRSGGRCRRRAKTSSYLVPVHRAALAWLASSCCQWPQRVQLLVTCAQPTSPHRPYWLRLSFSIRISRALSGPACDDPRTATIRHLRTCASLPLHLSPAKGSQWTHGAVRFTLLRMTLESTRFVGMKAAINPMFDSLSTSYAHPIDRTSRYKAEALCYRYFFYPSAQQTCAFEWVTYTSVCGFSSIVAVVYFWTEGRAVGIAP